MKRVTCVEFQKDEYWYGGAVNDGWVFPLGSESEYQLDIANNRTYNQINPVYLSSHGRCLWADECSGISFKNGMITAQGGQLELSQQGKTLKEASMNAAFKYYPPDGCIPDEMAFTGIQYCTWMPMGYNQNQRGILNYARSIKRSGLPAGLFIIDDTWQEYCGRWEFHPGRFPAPASMTAELIDMGFKVMLWTAPYITPDTPEFRDLLSKDFLLKNTNGNTLIVRWWNGYGAVLDLSKPGAARQFSQTLHGLKEKYGISGFKLDGGDAQFLGTDYPYGNLQNELWAGITAPGLREVRACYKHGGKAIIQRLADKAHSWTVEPVYDEKTLRVSYLKYGMSTVIPNILTQGLIGYYYGCPDMVGGGLYSDKERKSLDGEQLIRSCQMSALMPGMQFSLNLWDIDDRRVRQACLDSVKLRSRLSRYILDLARSASVTAQPIVRYLEYEYPGRKLEKISNQFLLGEDYLVAPVLEKGAEGRRVVFPPGLWRDETTTEIFGEGEHYVQAEWFRLPLFKRIDKEKII